MFKNKKITWNNVISINLGFFVIFLVIIYVIETRHTDLLFSTSLFMTSLINLIAIIIVGWKRHDKWFKAFAFFFVSSFFAFILGMFNLVSGLH